MGRIAQLQVDCPRCGKTTNVYVEESGAERANVKCGHCKSVFEFGPGMMFKPIAYVSAIPSWAEIKEEATAGQATPTKKSWKFWKAS